MRALFGAFVVAGAAIVGVALVLAVPFYETRAFEEMRTFTEGTGVQPMLELQAWPDYLMVPPGISLAMFLWTGGLLAAGGAVGLVAKHVEGLRLRILLALGVVGAAAIAIAIAVAASVPWDPGPAYQGIERALGEDARLMVQGRLWPVLPGTNIPIDSFATATAIAAAAALLAVLGGQWIAAPRGHTVLALATFLVALLGGILRGAPGGFFMLATAAVPLALAIALLVALAWLPLWAWMRNRAS